MELAAQCERADVLLELSWAPREVNVEADALSNHVYTGFTDELRINVDFANLDFLVLDDLMKAGLEFHDQKAKARVLQDAQAQPGGRCALSARGRGKRLRQDRLRVVEPW